MAVLTKADSLVPALFEAELENVDAGVLRNVPATASLMLNGAPLSQPQIDAKLKAYLASFAAAEAARQQYQAALAARRALTIEARDFFLQLKKALTAWFGAQNPVLADFGFRPDRPRAPRTAEQQLLAAAKAQLTREARGTKSKKKLRAVRPTVGTPMVAVSGEGKQVTPPLVVSPPLPIPPSAGPERAS